MRRQVLEHPVKAIRIKIKCEGKEKLHSIESSLETVDKRLRHFSLARSLRKILRFESSIIQERT